MITHPFRLFRPFTSRLKLNLFEKKDEICGRDDLIRSTGSDKLVGLRQVHGNRAVVVRSPSWREIEADAVFTDIPGLTLSVSFADCQNLVLFEPKRKVIGVVHAGWRGVAADIVTRALELLSREWGISAGEIFIGAGPSLCTRCAEFSDPENEVPALRDFISGRTIDLRGALENQLKLKGAKANRFERMAACTRCEPGRFWTYRGGHKKEVQNGNINCLTAMIKEPN
jgi:hypothetical protein